MTADPTPPKAAAPQPMHPLIRRALTAIWMRSRPSWKSRLKGSTAMDRMPLKVVREKDEQGRIRQRFEQV